MKLLRSALALTAVLTLLCGMAYPLAVTAAGRLAFPRAAAGSLVVVDGRVVGSELIGQEWPSQGWFRGRPSATAGRPYDAMASGGSNLGPSSEALRESVAARAAEWQASSPPGGKLVPIDLVTASGSGLDPHVSLAGALHQVPRVAAERGLQAAELERLVLGHSEGVRAGPFGEPRVNVLRLNVALRALAR